LPQDPIARRHRGSAGTAAADLAAARRRAALRGRVAICGALRRNRASSATPAALAAALRLGEEAAAELALIPDTARLRRRDRALLTGDREAGFAATIRRLAEAYANGRALDLFTASPAELLACCVARAGLAPPAAKGVAGPAVSR
jgi:hypothetical protein